MLSENAEEDKRSEQKKNHLQIIVIGGRRALFI